MITVSFGDETVYGIVPRRDFNEGLGFPRFGVPFFLRKLRMYPFIKMKRNLRLGIQDMAIILSELKTSKETWRHQQLTLCSMEK